MYISIRAPYTMLKYTTSTSTYAISLGIFLYENNATHVQIKKQNHGNHSMYPVFTCVTLFSSANYPVAYVTYFLNK
jgi:hypothetical protein